MSSPVVEQFASEGFVGPIPVLAPDECSDFLSAIRDKGGVHPIDWNKSWATTSRAYYEIANHPTIVDKVVELLGEDVMLWGASMLTRGPQAVHPWHSDMESALHTGSTVSVWVGIKGLTRESSLLLIPRSHRFGLTIQEERYRRGYERGAVGREDVEAWAKERDPETSVFIPDMADGDALFFDGQLWHGSHNESDVERQALLLQYATPTTRMRIPDFNSLDWPFTYLDLPKPPCIMIRGSSTGSSNRFVLPPSAEKRGESALLTSRSHRLDLPLATDVETGWKPYHLFYGATATHSTIGCHVSSLRPGMTPHPPHRHKEEELLMMLSGEADLLLPDLGDSASDQRVRLRTGQFVYYPAQFSHSLEAVGDVPANYLMFKWHNPPAKADSALRFELFDAVELARKHEEDGFSFRKVFEGPTECLGRLHAHTSSMTPGAGYDPHVDAYDVAIIVLTGEVETQGAVYGPDSVLYFPSGELHGMRNPGTETARYLVFEFHGHNGALPAVRQVVAPSFLQKVVDPVRWKRKIKALVRRGG